MIYALSSILLFLTYMIFRAHHDTIDYQVIVDQQLPEGFNNFRVFFIADIHRRNINEQTLNSIKLKIDIVLIGGDLTEKGVPLNRTKKNIQKLKKFAAPIFFVWGNNDYEVPIDSLIHLLHEENVMILQDTSKDIVRNGDEISLVGFDYHKDNDDHHLINWEKIQGKYTLLLTHKPSSFYQLPPYEKEKIHTVLAGHTHGGQIRLFGLGFYQKGGLTTHFQTNIFVTEGYGYTFLPFRLQTRAECHVLTFKKRDFKNE